MLLLIGSSQVEFCLEENKPDICVKNLSGSFMDAKILVVDDEPAIRKLLKRFLEGAGYSCMTAETVAAAKEILAAHTFDLLLSDLKMPGESGLDLVRHAKKHYPQMGRIMITGYGSPEIASEIMMVGVYGYIIKPVTKNVVLITVENALRHLRLDQHMHACRRELEENIMDRTEKLSSIMNNLNVGVVMFDRDMKILELNRTMRNWFPDITHGTSLSCYHAFQNPPQDGICDNCPMDETFRAGKTCEALKSVMTTQGEREYRIVTSPIIDHAGQIYAGIGLYEDVTEKILLERDLHQAQKLEAVGQMAAGIAHEINTPVQYIGDNISFLKDSFDDIARVLDVYQSYWQQLTVQGAVPDDFRRKMSTEIEAADLDYLWEEIPKTIEQSLDGIRRVAKIVRAMKDFSHPGGDEKSPVDINKILESTITVCRNEWKYVAEMETAFAPDLPLVSCFAGEISQVFLNIIVNGAHAISDVTEDGSRGKGKITVATNRMADKVCIRISDTGSGVPKEIQDRIFDAFFTTKARGKGTGQGLAIARRVVVDSHQGAISFETQSGEGTTFIVELPN